MGLLVVLTLEIGTLAVVNSMQQANADYGNGNEKKSCNTQHSDASRCSHKDSTPIILPFP